MSHEQSLCYGSCLGPINAWKPVVGMVGGILLLSEYPTPVGIAGLVLIVVGSYWILGAEKMVFSGGFFFVRIFCTV